MKMKCGGAALCGGMCSVSMRVIAPVFIGWYSFAHLDAKEKFDGWIQAEVMPVRLTFTNSLPVRFAHTGMEILACMAK